MEKRSPVRCLTFGGLLLCSFLFIRGPAPHDPRGRQRVGDGAQDGEGPAHGIAEVSGLITVRCLRPAHARPAHRSRDQRPSSSASTPQARVAPSQEMAEAVRRAQEGQEGRVLHGTVRRVRRVITSRPSAIKIFASAGTITASIGVISEAPSCRTCSRSCASRWRSTNPAASRTQAPLFRATTTRSARSSTTRARDLRAVPGGRRRRPKGQDQPRKAAPHRGWARAHGRGSAGGRLIDSIGQLRARARRAAELSGKAGRRDPGFHRTTADRSCSVPRRAATQVGQGLAEGLREEVRRDSASRRATRASSEASPVRELHAGRGFAAPSLQRRLVMWALPAFIVAILIAFRAVMLPFVSACSWPMSSRRGARALELRNRPPAPAPKPRASIIVYSHRRDDSRCSSSPSCRGCPVISRPRARDPAPPQAGAQRVHPARRRLGRRALRGPGRTRSRATSAAAGHREAPGPVRDQPRRLRARDRPRARALRRRPTQRQRTSRRGASPNSWPSFTRSTRRRCEACSASARPSSGAWPHLRLVVLTFMVAAYLLIDTARDRLLPLARGAPTGGTNFDELAAEMDRGGRRDSAPADDSAVVNGVLYDRWAGLFQ